MTNPPIDPLREEMVMSLKMSLGPEQNLFGETPEHCQRVLINTHPILTAGELEKIRQLRVSPFAVSNTLSLLFSTVRGAKGLEGSR